MIAKLTRPRTGAVLDRVPLYRLLDEARRSPAVWVHGPPGSGKTTAISRYTSERKLETIWYLIDEGDADPAAFFYYLRQSAGAAREAALPLLTPEYFADLPRFARRFFRRFFETMHSAATGAVLVLDNAHVLEPGNPLLDLLPSAIDEIGPQATLFVISRQGPSSGFARAVVGAQLSVIRPQDL